MALINFVDPADAEGLKTYGDDIFVRTNKVFARRRPQSHKIKTAKRRTSATVFQDIVELWESLTPAERSTWETYFTEVPDSKNAYNAFVKNNMQGLYPAIADIAAIRSITTPAQFPSVPKDFQATYNYAQDAIICTWTNTYTDTTWIEAWEFIVPGRRRNAWWPWRFVAWAPAADESLSIDVSDLDVGRETVVSIRALNNRGEVSALAEPQTVQKTAAPPLPDYLFFANRNLHNIHRHYTSDLSHITTLSTRGGSFSTFDRPCGVHADTTHLYVLDTYHVGDEICKYTLPDFTFVDSGPSSTPDLVGRYPYQLDGDDDYIYIASEYGITKHRKSDLARVLYYVDWYTTWLYHPHGICEHGTSVYLCDTGNHRIQERAKSDFSLIQYLGSQGSGDDQFDTPHGIATDGTYLYIADTNNHRIKIHLVSNLSYVDKFGSYNNPFIYPRGVDVDDSYIYVSDSGNDRIRKFRKSDHVQVAHIGPPTDNIDEPRQICTSFT